MANVPTVNSFLEGKATEAVVAELLLHRPAGRTGGFVIKYVKRTKKHLLCFAGFLTYLSLPVPYVRKALFVTASKRLAMLKRGDNLDAKLRTPKKDRSAKVAQSVPVIHAKEASFADGEKRLSKEKELPKPKKEEPVAPKKAEDDSFFGARFTNASKNILALFDNNNQSQPQQQQQQKQQQQQQQPQEEQILEASALPPVPSRQGNSSYVLSEEAKEAEEDNTIFQNDASIRKRDKLKKLASDLLK